MPGLLDRLTSEELLTDPRLAMAAGLLSPTPGGSFGGGLSQGLLGYQQQRGANQQNQLGALQQQAAKQKLAQLEAQAQARKQASLLGPQEAFRALMGQGDVQGVNALSGFLKSQQADAVKAQSPLGQIMSDFQKGFLTEDQAAKATDNALRKPAGSTKTVSVMRNGVPSVVLVDNAGNEVANLGQKPPSAPLIDFGGLTRSQQGNARSARKELEFGQSLTRDILSELKSGSEPAGITRSIKGGLQSAVDQLKTAANEVTDGAVSSALKGLSSTFSDASRMLKKDIDDGVITEEQAEQLGFVGGEKPIAVTDLKRNLLTYMVARLNVGTGQKITNQMIQEAQQQTQIGGFGGGGRDIAIGRFETLDQMFDAKIQGIDELLNQSGGGNDAAAQLKAVMEALSQ